MATVAINSPDIIQFVNISGQKTSGDPTIIFQSGEWGTDKHSESGIVVDVSGEQLPLLDASNARKLARWLERAADALDGVKHHNNKKRSKHFYAEDENDDFSSRY